MSNVPSSSTAGPSGIRRSKAAEKRQTKSKKDDNFTSSVGSISLNKMMGAGSANDKQAHVEEKSREGIRNLLELTNLRASDASVDMLAAYARQLTREMLTRAQKAAEHADRSQIETDDINLVATNLMPKIISKAERIEMGKLINAQEFPKLRNSALHLPVDRCCIINPEYAIPVDKKPEEEPVPTKIAKTSKSAVESSQMTNILKNPDDAYD